MRKYLMFRKYISDISIPKHILRIIYELKKRAIVESKLNKFCFQMNQISWLILEMQTLVDPVIHLNYVCSHTAGDDWQRDGMVHMFQ